MRVLAYIVLMGLGALAILWWLRIQERQRKDEEERQETLARAFDAEQQRRSRP